MENLPAPAEGSTSIAVGMLDGNRFALIERYADKFAGSALVPSHFRDRPADCFIAVQMADRLGVDPFMLMQSLYVVSGRPGLEGKLVIALVNSRGPFVEPLQWAVEYDEKSGAPLAARCFGTLPSGKVCEARVDMAMAVAEGWTRNAKWQSMPEHMLKYRSAAFLARTVCPEVIMGMHTIDELRDSIDVEAREVSDAPAPAARIAPAPAPVDKTPQADAVEPTRAEVLSAFVALANDIGRNCVETYLGAPVGDADEKLMRRAIANPDGFTKAVAAHEGNQ